MGCNIHAHVEYRCYDGAWLPFRTELRRRDRLAPVLPVSQEVEIERDYTLFARLAGARADETDDPPIAAPRGLPADCSVMVRAEYHKQRGDAHHTSWLSFSEILGADWGHWTDFNNPQTRAAAVCDHGSPQWFLEQVRRIPCGLTDDFERLRLVFWFDN